MKRKGTLLDFWSKRHKPGVSIELFPSQVDDSASENNYSPSVNLFQSPMLEASNANSADFDAPYQDSEE